MKELRRIQRAMIESFLYLLIILIAATKTAFYLGAATGWFFWWGYAVSCFVRTANVADNPFWYVIGALVSVIMFLYGVIVVCILTFERDDS